VIKIARINPPVFNVEKGYERFKIELKAWGKVTSIPSDKQAITVVLESFSDKDSIKDRIFDGSELMNSLEDMMD
jgi:hypothetical protein